MTEHCDRAWEIDALREGRLAEKDAEAFERHARSCDVCTRSRAENDRLRRLAESLPSPAPSALDVRRLRARVLRDVELRNPAPAPWNRKTVVGLAVAAVAIIAFGSHARKPIPAASNSLVMAAPVASTHISIEEFAGLVTPANGTRWTQARASGIEHVRLDDGSLQLHVRHQVAGEQFFVDVPDGVIEVRGTTFRVDVANGATKRIDVTEGVVSFRPSDGAESLIGAGQTWVPTMTAAPSASHRAATTAAPGSSVADLSDQRTSDEYAAAVALWQNGSYDAAAKSFAAFLSAHPSAPEAEDASYLEAAALARAGRTDAAALAAEHHLTAYPRSFHRKEAATLVARAARDRGDCAKAREALAPWLGAAPDADAVATLRSCASP